MGQVGLEVVQHHGQRPGRPVRPGVDRLVRTPAYAGGGGEVREVGQARGPRALRVAQFPQSRIVGPPAERVRRAAQDVVGAERALEQDERAREGPQAQQLADEGGLPDPAHALHHEPAATSVGQDVQGEAQVCPPADELAERQREGGLGRGGPGRGVPG